MKFKELKFIMGILLVSMLSISTMSRMVISKENKDESPIKEENSIIDDQKKEFKMKMERNLAEVPTVDSPPERELKEKKKNKTKVVKKKKTKKSNKNRKLNLSKIKFEKKEDQKKLEELTTILKKHGANIKEISNKKIQMIIKKKSKKGRKLWWWWHRRQAQIRRQRAEAARRRREAERRRREAARRRRMHQAHIRHVLARQEKTYLLELQRNKLKQLDRNKFDKLMQKERKKDSELWSRTFIYDAILLTEKLVYLEHEKMFNNQMKLAVANENKIKSKLEKFYNKNYGKKLSELTPKEIEEDIFM
jgi:hypothetical protein